VFFDRTSSRARSWGGREVGFEVLARWLHRDRGLLLPGQFLPMAEESGLLAQLAVGL
jgi:EAL domain-containing protein (putative c-di-GMP-specific phosphodiesterase class I)